MIFRRTRYGLITTVWLLFATLSLPELAALSLDDALPFHPDVEHGTLANGLEYFALEHPHPQDKLILRLVVDAGSVLETDAQRGLAHFVEHMAFNGTEEFGENELVAYLESLGVRFGPDVNAYTSFDETVYMLEIPADDPEALRTGLRVMQQWADAIRFDEEAIERERGVIVEEWRGGRGAARRMLETHIPVILAGSRYADRLPIGILEVIRNAPREEFVRFYRRWYRPDNMAFIAVGDLPARRIAELIEEHLSDVPRPTTNLARPVHTVPRREGTRVSVASDPEAAQHTVSVYILDDPRPFSTVGDYRELLVRSLFSSVINERVRDIARDPDAPITGGGIGYNRFLRDTEIAIGTVVVRDDRVLEALEVLQIEIERARRYGVLESELERARRRFLQSIEDARVNVSSRPSASLASELIRHWIEGEAMPGVDVEYRLYRELLPGISASEVSAVADDFAREDGRVVLASMRDDGAGRLPDGSDPPSESELMAALRSVSSIAIAPPQEVDGDTALMADEPRPGTIVARHHHPAVDVHEYHLSNGMRVFVRQTDFSEDEILFSAYSPGGLALVDDSLVAAAELTAGVMSESGLGALDASALEHALAGTSVTFTTSIGRASEGMAGTSRAADLETLFQMINLAFTDPRFDERALENVRRRTLQAVRGAAASPQGRFSTTLQEAFAAGDPRLRVSREAELATVTLEEIQRVYRDRFARPSDFALFFVGSADPEEIARLAERYVAGIESPAGETAASRGDRRDDAGFIEAVDATAYPRPEGVVYEEVRAGTEPVAQLAMLLHGPYRWSREENHRFNSLADYLDIRLREVIREDAGGAYSIGAGGWRWRRPEQWAFMQIAFGLSPDRVEELRSLTFEVIEEVRTTAPTENHLERVKAQQRDSWRQSVRENGYWLSTISFFVEHGRDLADIPDFPELIDSLTAEDILRSAQRYLDPERRVEVLLLPAEG